MKISRYLPSSNAPESAFEKDLDRSLDKIFAELFEILNKGIRLDDNLNSYITTFTTSATPGEETAIPHGLKRLPLGFIVLEKDKPAHIFNGQTVTSARVSTNPQAVLNENYYIQSDVESVTVTILIV